MLFPWAVLQVVHLLPAEVAVVEYSNGMPGFLVGAVGASGVNQHVAGTVGHGDLVYPMARCISRFRLVYIQQLHICNYLVVAHNSNSVLRREAIELFHEIRVFLGGFVGYNLAEPVLNVGEHGLYGLLDGIFTKDCDEIDYLLHFENFVGKNSGHGNKKSRVLFICLSFLERQHGQDPVNGSRDPRGL
jgi:hypothetical protein